MILKQTCLCLIAILILTTGSVHASEINDISMSGEIIHGSQRLGGEAVEFITEPLQLKNSNILITLGVAGAFALTYTFDKQIQEKVTAHPTRTLDKAADAGSLAGDPYLHLGLAALIYGGAIAADSAKWKETGEMLGEALILSDAASFIIKESSGRGRPSVSASKSDFRPFGFRRDYDSLPSMHTSSSFALASVLAATSDSIIMKAAYYGAAGFVSFSRMYKNKHWASDVLLGAVIGEFSGRVVTSYHAGRNKMALAPQAYEGGAGLALVGTW
jgi:membrane-associated phospholipid phosphatase